MAVEHHSNKPGSMTAAELAPVSTLLEGVMLEITATGALFRAIARLSEDADIKALADQGRAQCEMQAGDLDCMVERLLHGRAA